MGRINVWNFSSLAFATLFTERERVQVEYLCRLSGSNEWYVNSNLRAKSYVNIDTKVVSQSKI